MFWELRLCTHTCVVPSPRPSTVAAGMSPVSATFVADRLSVIAVPVPSAPTGAEEELGPGDRAPGRRVVAGGGHRDVATPLAGFGLTVAAAGLRDPPWRG